MKKIFIFILLNILLYACDSSISNYLTGTWRIENPSPQSYISFKPNGEAFYYPNQISLLKDTLVTKGTWNWSYKNRKKKDTLLLKIEGNNRFLFEIVILGPDKIKAIENQKSVYFSRFD